MRIDLPEFNYLQSDDLRSTDDSLVLIAFHANRQRYDFWQQPEKQKLEALVIIRHNPVIVQARKANKTITISGHHVEFRD